ncbi:MAG: hypothetical protein GC160_29265 [Acidobacteria bacterium]|nr:hypothetical protein [Acidobacteriota bacterium]
MEADEHALPPDELDLADGLEDASWAAALESLAEELDDPPPPAPEPAVNPEPLAHGDPLGDLIGAIDAAIAADRPEARQVGGLPLQVLRGYVVFALAGERYAAPLDRVVELDRVTALTPVPNTPGFMLGVTNVRGRIIPAVELRQLFGLPSSPRPEAGRMMQLRGPSESWIAGAVVDDLHGIRAFDEGDMLRADALDDSVSSLLAGVYEDEGELLKVLDVDRLFSGEAMRSLSG